MVSLFIRAYILPFWSVRWQHNFDGKGDMTTGTVIMIVCAVVYGLIVFLFREKGSTSLRNESFMGDDPFVCTDGTPGADGLLADDFDKVSSE